MLYKLYKQDSPLAFQFFLEFQKIYDRLEISLIERGESFYHDMMGNVLKMIEEKGIALDFNWSTEDGRCDF